MILGVHHPALAVPDLQQVLGFYCGVLGFRVVMEAEIPSGVEPLDRAMGVADAGCRVRMIRKGNSCIELFQFASGETGEGEAPVRWAYGRDPFGNVIELLEHAPSGPMALRFDD
jgi:catechol 2,3-dioxygenase-like lactoylglutathione lyase family enzyme